MTGATSSDAQYTGGTRPQPQASIATLANMVATTRSRGARCHFFRLRAELRSYIYELSLYPQPANRRIDPDSSGPSQLACRSSLGYHLSDGYKPPVLLAVNRQIRAEASKAFYARTLFFRYNLEKTEQMVGKWLASLEAVDRGLVKSFKAYEDMTECGYEEDIMVRAALLAKFGFQDWLMDLLEIAIEDHGVEAGWRYTKVREILASLY